TSWTHGGNGTSPHRARPNRSPGERSGATDPCAEGISTVSASDDLLRTARGRLQRVTPRDLPGEMAAGALVVDIRPDEQRRRDGDLPGALVIYRTVLERGPG